MYFSVEGHVAKCEFNFVTNSKKAYANINERVDPVSHLENSLDVIFTQMSANTSFKRYVEPTISEMVKEFPQLNQGVVRGKPVVVTTDARTLNDRRKKVFPFSKPNKIEIKLCVKR